ncbi:MAG: hypothetical protein GX386_05775 [Clostridiaceae bacterium]|jgi:hypothetical protein|nr:hypothetical protein [Clostridiaceae bacterium]
MNVAFLGESTEEKRFLILCLAKIASCHENITVLSKKAYSFDEIGENYEYCGIEFVMIKEGENPLSGISETANYFVDVEEYIEIPDSFKVIVISETTRTKLESCIKLVGEFAWFQPTLNIYIIYLNIMEYCKIGRQYLSCFWEHGLPSFTEIAGTNEIYFEEKNRIVMIESQYSNRLPIRKLSSPIRAVLKNIIRYIFSLDPKEAKAVLKRAERMK